MPYRVLIDQDEDGVYVAEVPAIPGCISQGRTRSEAIDSTKEAIGGCLESLQAHAEPVPPRDWTRALGATDEQTHGLRVYASRSRPPAKQIR